VPGVMRVGMSAVPAIDMVAKGLVRIIRDGCQKLDARHAALILMLGVVLAQRPALRKCALMDLEACRYQK